MALVGVNYCLELIGFDDDEPRHWIMDDGQKEFEDFSNATEDDISDMAEAFRKRIVMEGRVLFGHGRIKKLKGLMHWVQDKLCCSDPIDHNKFTLDEMNEAIERAAARKVEQEQSETTSKVAEPSKFTKESQWPSFYLAFVNYLSTILGVFGLPLHYVICKIATPAADAVYNSFTE